MQTERRCPSCRGWYDKSEGDCPDCGEEQAKFNKWLRTAQINKVLYQQAERAWKDR